MIDVESVSDELAASSSLASGQFSSFLGSLGLVETEKSEVLRAVQIRGPVMGESKVVLSS